MRNSKIVNLSWIALLFISLVFFQACKGKPVELPIPPPIATFNFTPLNNDLRAPSEISFTPDENNAGASFSWDFGDGTSSSEKSPKKVYTVGGSKVVKLTVTNGGQSKSETKNIVISNAYTKVYITKSTIQGAATSYPDGTNWDLASTSTDLYLNGTADVYLIAKYDNLTAESYYTSIKTNVTALQLTNGSLFWDHNAPGFNISNAAASTQNLRIELRDADVNGNFWTSNKELMGFIDLKLSDLMQIGNKYPTSIELKGASNTSLTANQKFLNDALKIKLDLSWAE